MVIQNQTASLNAEKAALSAEYNLFVKNEDKLLQIQKEIEFSRNKLSSDSLLMVRHNNIWAQGIGTKTEKEKRELNYLNSKTTYFNLNIKYQEVKKQLKFAANQSKTSLLISRSILNDFTIKSEMTGRVYSITKEVGEFVSTQSSLGMIGDDNHFILELQLDEYDIIKIKEGLEVIVKFDSYQDTVFEARVNKIKPLLNEKTRTFVAHRLVQARRRLAGGRQPVVEGGVGERDVPVRFAGVTFQPGYHVYADEDGLLVSEKPLL